MRLSPVDQKGDDASSRQGSQKSRKGRTKGKIESWHIAIMLAAVAIILIVFYFAEKDDWDPGALLQQANELHDTRKFSEAIELYKKYLDQNPRDVDARVDMGICYFELGDFQTARSEMEKGLAINPKHQLAYYNLGIVSMQERNIEQARQWFERTIAIDSTTEIAKRSRMMIQQHSFPMKNK
jgi:tetratricopeptide (TPR) repeat protein